MLHEFLETHRTELIRRCRAKVAKRRAPRPTPHELEHGVPLFLDQLTQLLPGRDGFEREAPTSLAESRMRESATQHG